MTASAFAQAVALINYVPKGVFYSEVYLFLARCAAAGVARIIESGVKHGTSTRLFAAAFDGPVISIDRRLFIDLPVGVTFIEGDACEILPALLWDDPTPTGVFIDGPKGMTALALKDVCLEAGARVVAVHDVLPGCGETFHSHLAGADRWLDAPVSPAYRAKYPLGPGLGIWEGLCVN